MLRKMTLFNFKTILLVLAINILYTNSQLIYSLVGGLSSNSFEIKAKSQDGKLITLFLNGTTQGAYLADTDYYYSIKVNNLLNATTYLVELQYDQQAGNKTNFTLQTFPNIGNQKDFTFVAGSNMYTDTKSFVFEKIRSLHPNFFMFLGNLYEDRVNSDDWKEYEKQYIKCKYINININLIDFSTNSSCDTKLISESSFNIFLRRNGFPKN
jgi:hypothetical protein